LNTKVTTQETEDVVSNKHTLVLFRYQLSNKTDSLTPLYTQFRYMNTQIHLKLELFKNGVLVDTKSGLGNVNMRRSLIDVADATSKYILQGSIDEFDHLLVENAGQDQPDWTTDKHAGTTKKKAASSLESKPTKLTSAWKLRFMFFDNAILCVKDSERDNKFREMKKQWESSDPLRASKAREVRDAYLKLVEGGHVKPYYVKSPCGRYIKPWTILNDQGKIIENTLKRGLLDKIDLRVHKSIADITLEHEKDFNLLEGVFGDGSGPKVLSDKENEEISRKRESTKEEHSKVIGRIQEYKAMMCDRSKRINEKGTKIWDHITELSDLYNKEDAVSREEYRLQVTKRVDDEAARRVQESAEQLRDQSSKALQAEDTQARRSAKKK